MTVIDLYHDLQKAETPEEKARIRHLLNSTYGKPLKPSDKEALKLCNGATYGRIEKK